MFQEIHVQLGHCQESIVNGMLIISVGLLMLLEMLGALKKGDQGDTQTMSGTLTLPKCKDKV